MSPDFRQLFESIPGCFVVLSRDFKIVAVSDDYLKSTMTSREEIVGRTIFEAFPRNPKAPVSTSSDNLLDSFFRVIETKLPDAMAVQKNDIQRPKAEGGGFEERYWSILNSPVFDESKEVKYIIHRAEDVTELVRKNQQQTGKDKPVEELKAEDIRIENEILQRNHQLEEANQKLLEAEKVKNEFFTSVSAELRTPLSLILGPLESRLAGQYGEVSEAQFQFLQTVHNNAIRLLQMVNGLLDFTKFEGGQMTAQPEPTDVGALVTSVVNDFAPMMKSKKIELKLDRVTSEKYVMLDRYIFERILFNLVSNAVKFTRSGGHIAVELKTQNNRLELSVKDDGIGIESNKIDTLFKKFSQSGGSSAHRYEGTGLGLAMVKEFTEVLGGTVTVNSHLGTGSTFTVDIEAPATYAVPERAYTISQRAPLNPSNAGQPTEEEIETQDDKKRHKVLVCEDNEELAVYIGSLLRDFCVIKTARDGEEGLALVKSWKPDLVLSDFMMPKVNGIEMCKAIKENPETAHIVVILLTALTHRAAMLRGWDAKADEYLFKPFHPNELTTRVRSLLSVTTDRKKATELITQKDTELKGAYGELESLSYSASHDLLGPLHNIGGYAQIVLKDYGSKLDDDGRKTLEQIRTLTAKMSDLVTNLFRFVRASHMELIPNKVDMNRLVEDVVDEIKMQNPNFAAEVKVRFLPSCECDLHLLHQVWCCLIGNAVKYTSSRPDPIIEIGCKDVDGQPTYFIKDNGVGFDMRYAHKLFLPFERLHHDTEFTGSGMGLALAQRIIERHGGKIWAESMENVGTSFYFTLPSIQAEDVKNETPRK